MPLLKGEDLGDRLKARGRLALGQTVILGSQVASALDGARAAGVDAEYVLTYVSKMDEKFYELLEEKSLRDAS